MIHDYGNIAFAGGVRKAIMQFESEFEVHVPRVPIPDKNGSVVLTK